MGESACWLHLICGSCGSVDAQLDDDGCCPACRARDSAVDPGDEPQAQGPPAPPADSHK